MARSTSTVSGRPDNKTETNIYYDGLGGLRAKTPYAIKPNLTDLLKEQEQLLIGVDDDAEQSGVECVAVGDISYSYTDAGMTKNTLYVVSGVDDYRLYLNGSINSEYETIVVSNIDGYAILTLNDIGSYKRLYTSSESGDYGLPWVGNTNLGNTSKIIKTNPELTSSGTNTSIDVIGNPAKYISTDAAATVDGVTDNNVNNIAANSLVWYNDKMYRTKEVFDMKDGVLHVDNDDDDGSGDAIDMTDTTKVEYVIGRYPNSWYERLGRGLSLPFNPLLVNQDGTTAIYADTNTPINTYNITASTKVKEGLALIRNDGDCTVFVPNATSGSDTFNQPSSAQWLQTLMVWQYTSYNTPTVQSAPKPILQVSDRVIGTSSFSEHQGCMLTAAATGKIATNTGKGLVSKVVEDCEVSGATFTTTNADTSILYGTDHQDTKILIVGGYANTDRVGEIVHYIGTTVSNTINGQGDSFVQDAWETVGIQLKQPRHDTIDLSSSSSAASKSLIALIEDENGIGVQVMSEEMVWDFDNDDYNEVETYAAGDGEVTATKTRFRLSGFDNSQFNGIVFEWVNGDTFNWSADQWVGYEILPDGSIVHYSGTPYTEFRVWDGNGFGCFGDFQTLTNSTSTDMNGNTVRNYCGIKRLNMYS